MYNILVKLLHNEASIIIFSLRYEASIIIFSLWAVFTLCIFDPEGWCFTVYVDIDVVQTSVESTGGWPTMNGGLDYILGVVDEQHAECPEIK